MIKINEPPSNQMQLELDGFTDKGKQLMEDARKFVAHNWVGAWVVYMRIAREQCAGGFKASPNFVLQSMRAECHVTVPNSYAPALARIAMEQDKSLHFNLGKSMVDGFTKAVL